MTVSVRRRLKMSINISSRVKDSSRVDTNTPILQDAHHSAKKFEAGSLSAVSE